MKVPKGARAGEFLPGLILPAAVLLIWILASASGLKPALIPTPQAVLSILARPFDGVIASGSIFWNCTVSIIRVLTGFTIAVLTAVPMGLLMGSSSAARRFLALSVELARPLSPLAMTPLMLVLFRSRTVVDVLGLTSLRYSHSILHEIQIGMIAVQVWGGFFPILLGAASGARSVRRIHLEVAELLGAGRAMIFRHLTLPSAIPDIPMSSDRIVIREGREMFRIERRSEPATSLLSEGRGQRSLVSEGTSRETAVARMIRCRSDG